MRRFLTAGWIAAHLVVVAVAGTCLTLGIWQLRRLDERRSQNAVLHQRATLPAVPLPSLFPGSPPLEAAAGAAYRSVAVSGTYYTAGERLTGPRSLRGTPGRHILTPLRTAMGYDVFVERGWIPLDAAPGLAAPPKGEVHLMGVLMPPEPSSAFRRNTAGGPVVKIDPAELNASAGRRVLPLFLRLGDQRPPQATGLPAMLDPPRPAGNGPHLSYAVQWFIFGAIAAGGYALVVRRQARRPDDDISGAPFLRETGPAPTG